MTSPAASTAIPDTLRLLKARELAAQGRLREAEAFLGGADAPSADPALLQSLAVIVTQQGDYPRARRLWRQLLQARPGDLEAERMIEAIETWQARPAWIGYLPAAAACGLIALLALVFWPRGGGTSAPAAVEPLVVVPVEPVRPVPVATAPAPRPVLRAPQPAPVAPPADEPMVTFELPAPRSRR